MRVRVCNINGCRRMILYTTLGYYIGKIIRYQQTSALTFKHPVERFQARRRYTHTRFIY